MYRYQVATRVDFDENNYRKRKLLRAISTVQSSSTIPYTMGYKE
jgi:hypothetical protein